jgi:hypothetical protein
VEASWYLLKEGMIVPYVITPFTVLSFLYYSTAADIQLAWKIM